VAAEPCQRAVRHMSNLVSVLFSVIELGSSAREPFDAKWDRIGKTWGRKDNWVCLSVALTDGAYSRQSKSMGAGGRACVDQLIDLPAGRLLERQ
jgi:hypothetical protein